MSEIVHTEAKIEESPSRGVVNPEEPRCETKSDALTESKQREAELERYLEETVFPKFSITEEDRLKKIDGLAKEGKTAEAITICGRSFENIQESIRIAIHKYGEITNRPLSEEIAKEFMQKVAGCIDRISDNLSVTYSLDFDGFNDAMQTGNIIGLTGLGKEELSRVANRRQHQMQWNSQYARGENSYYISGRRIIERELGYGPGTVYGKLQSGEPEGILRYGPITFELNPKEIENIYFTEGDSLELSKMVGVIACEKIGFSGGGKDREEIIIEAGKKRQLIFEHAVISKALTDILDGENMHRNHQQNGGLEFLEAHIQGGIDLDSEAITGIRLWIPRRDRGGEGDIRRVQSVLSGTKLEGKFRVDVAR